MNIDKMYKELVLYVGYMPYYVIEDVQELEKKYKELLVFIDHIKECIDTDTWGLNAVDEILKRHLGSED